MRFFAVFLTVFCLLMPVAYAQIPTYNPFFGWESGTASKPGTAGDTTATNEDGDDLVTAEVERTFTRRGVTVIGNGLCVEAASKAVKIDETENKTTVTFTNKNSGCVYRAYISVHRNQVVTTYGVRQKYAVYVKVQMEVEGNTSVVVVGRGENYNLRKAAEKAANEAANRLRPGTFVSIVAP